MAMSKKEKVAHDAEIDRLTTRLALCWTPEVRPDIPPPVNSSNAMTVGWLTSFDRVEPGCSTSSCHGRFQTKKADSQRAVSLYSTKLLALRAVRHEMEKRFAAELKRIDDWIQIEIDKPTPLQ